MPLLGPFLSSRFTGLFPAGPAALLTRTAFAVTLVLLAGLASLTTLLLATLLLATLTLLIALMLLTSALALTLVITLLITLLHIFRLPVIGRHMNTPAVIELAGAH
jgi:hypothetical protein